MILGIEHSAILTPNPKQLAAWYRETLGFAVSYESSSTVILKSQNGSMLEVTTSQGERAPAKLKDAGLRHLAIAVSDFDSVYQDLKARGVSFVSEPVETKGNKVVFFCDPEGNFLHLLYREKPLP